MAQAIQNTPDDMNTFFEVKNGIFTLRLYGINVPFIAIFHNDKDPSLIYRK